MSQKCNSSDHSGNVCCGDCDSGCGCEVTIANGGRNFGFGADGADASHGPYNYDNFSVGDVGGGGGDGVGGAFQGGGDNAVAGGSDADIGDDASPVDGDGDDASLVMVMMPPLAMEVKTIGSEFRGVVPAARISASRPPASMLRENVLATSPFTIITITTRIFTIIIIMPFTF